MMKKRKSSPMNDEDIDAALAEALAPAPLALRKEQEKDAALEAAAKKARVVDSVFFEEAAADADLWPSFPATTAFPTPRGGSSSSSSEDENPDVATASLVAQTRRIAEEKRAREEEEEKAMAAEMREIARLQREAEQIEAAAKAAEAENLARLRVDAETFERHAAYELSLHQQRGLHVVPAPPVVPPHLLERAHHHHPSLGGAGAGAPFRFVPLSLAAVGPLPHDLLRDPRVPRFLAGPPGHATVGLHSPPVVSVSDCDDPAATNNRKPNLFYPL
mmetsp:Transcript_13299/g.43330  ORF Transcript_13299/g.43330 Transcript_13299/m.43330 type:complete len:275 (-) Transcript_13299:1450-2274(-)